MKLLYILLGLLFVFSINNAKSQCPLNSPEVILMADGGGSTYSWHAGLYNVSQIGGAGTITSISFRLDNPWSPAETYNNQYIYMRHTSVTDYNGNQTYPGTAGFTLVWSGTLNINSNGFYNITLTTPFNYNGTDVLEVLIENKSNHSPYDDLWFDRTDASATIYNGKLGAGYSWSGATSNNTKRLFNLALGFNTPNSVNCNSFESTLPIVLKTFAVKKENNYAKINWVTASETNNDYFTIERSVDGINFTEIKKIKGAGNSNEQINYSIIDEDIQQGTNYYRLKQTDFDGKYTYSKIQAVNFDDVLKPDFNIYPNPASTFVQIKGKDIKGKSVKIYDITGKLLITFEKLKSFEKLNISNLQKGMYFVTINNSKPVKLIKN